jgi:hypothetical protein
MLKKRQEQYMKEQGRTIETEFQGVISGNGKNSFRVLTQWKNPSLSEVPLYERNDLWYDPSSLKKEPVDQSIFVVQAVLLNRAL